MIQIPGSGNIIMTCGRKLTGSAAGDPPGNPAAGTVAGDPDTSVPARMPPRLLQDCFPEEEGTYIRGDLSDKPAHHVSAVRRNRSHRASFRRRPLRRRQQRGFNPSGYRYTWKNLRRTGVQLPGHLA